MPENVLGFVLANLVTLAALAISGLFVLFAAFFLLTNFKLLRLGLKNLWRAPVRTLATTSATLVLVFMIVMIWTVLYGLDRETREKAKDFKIIVTERWQVPSLLPATHANYLDPKSPQLLSDLQGEYGPNDFMTWSFYGGSMDASKRLARDVVFFFVMNPDSIKPMMDELDKFDDAIVQKMKTTVNGCILGKEKLEAIGKRVGERFKLYSLNYKGLDLDFEIVGTFPEGRYNQSGIMNIDYFNRAFDTYAKNNGGTRHPMENKRLNLIWIRVQSSEQFDRIGGLIETAPVFSERPVKVERGSSLIGSFLENYSSLINGMKYLLVPAVLVIMALVMSNAISISVRERRTEMAVMKVLGFTPSQILQLVLAEALLVGGLSGLASAAGTYALFNWYFGGIPFRIGFFPVFRIPEESLLWGLAIGVGTSFLGSFLPAWSARSVKVSEVFSRVA